MGSLWGTLTASAVLNFLSLRGYFGAYDDAVFGGILVAVMLFAPDGILKADLRSLASRLAAGRRPPGEEALMALLEVDGLASASEGSAP